MLQIRNDRRFSHSTVVRTAMDAVAPNRILIPFRVGVTVEKMAFLVIEGGLAAHGWENGQNAAQVDVAQVRREGARRLRDSGYDRLEARRRMTGIAVPRSVDHFRMQIEFVVGTLSRLDPIPADFRNDCYWPTFDTA